MVLGVLLVWSAWPTVAGAFDGADARATSPVTPATVSTTATPSTTVNAPPPSTAVAPAPAPATEPPPTVPATAAPVPDAPVEVASPASTQAPAPAVVAATTPNVCDAAVGDIVAAMNRDRAGNGVGPLCANAQLTGLAQAWADHLAQTQTFVHQDLLAIISTTPFRRLAENLLVGSGLLSVDGMEGAWMASPGHRDNILDSRLVAAGVGMAVSAAGSVYVVVDFGGDIRA